MICFSVMFSPKALEYYRAGSLGRQELFGDLVKIALAFAAAQGYNIMGRSKPIGAGSHGTYIDFALDFRRSKTALFII